MKYISLLFYFIIINFNLLKSNSESILNNFKIINNIILNSNARQYLIEKSTTQNKFKCLALCNKQRECVSCTYDSNQNCELYNEELIATKNEINGYFIHLYTKAC